MECCGFVGPQEFAYSTLPIDDSCYEPPALDSEEDADMAPNSLARLGQATGPQLRLKQVNFFMQISCKFYANFMQISCKFYANFMQILCKFYANVVRVFLISWHLTTG